MSDKKIYELDYTGPEVDEAIYKIRNLDLSNLGGGITELDSTEATPYNLNFLRTPGMYKANYLYGATAPDGVQGVSPVYIYVSKENDGTENGKLIQAIDAGETEYNRVSVDGGLTWGDWVLEDGLDGGIEITRDEVRAMFDEVFGTESNEEVSGTTEAASAPVAQSVSAPTTSTATASTRKSVAS